MKYRTAAFYPEFHCIGGICEDSCCENWEIDLDDYSLKQYMKQTGDFGKRLKHSTRVKDKQFILNGTRCPFLNDENLCDIYINMGEECLCETCTNFPRHVEEFDDLKEVSLTMSCPEASRIMLARKEKMTFVCKEGVDEDYGLKPVMPLKGFAKLFRNRENKMDERLFLPLFKSRELFFLILQERSIPIAMRAAAVLYHAGEIQGFIEFDRYSEIEKLNRDIEKSISEGNLLGSITIEEQLKGYLGMQSNKTMWLREVLNMYEGLENIKQEWKAILQCGMKYTQTQQESMEFDVYMKDREYEFEHILVYYLFQYFLGAAYDRDALTKVKMAVVSFLIIRHLDYAKWCENSKVFTYEDQVLVAHAYSKEVEHSYNNYESLQLVLSAHPLLSIEQILVGLLS